MSGARKLLVVGAGGREHAIVRALRRGPRPPEVIAAPGNAGIARDGVRCLEVGAEEVDRLVAAAHAERCELVVVGPEAPLVRGLVDELGVAGVRAFGPSAAAARVEGSKAYAKELMREVGAPTAAHVVLRDREEAAAHLACASYPAVLKADALAAGKGVVICPTEADARAALDAFFVERRFGNTTVLLEELLEGEELSLLALCDGERAVPMAPARDFKRIFDGDRGPNTGGMGSYSPVAEVDDERTRELVDRIHQPIVEELRRRGTPYHGVLYAGLMMTAAGPRVLEFNCRLGDPETQAILPRLRTDMLELLEGAVRPGGLAGAELEWAPEYAVTVVLASRGYPESSSRGDPIEGVEEAEALGAEVLHAGTALDAEGRLVTAGGRVLAVAARGADVEAARERAYRAAERVRFEGRQMRRDIALGLGERAAAAART